MAWPCRDIGGGGDADGVSVLNRNLLRFSRPRFQQLRKRNYELMKAICKEKLDALLLKTLGMDAKYKTLRLDSGCDVYSRTCTWRRDPL
jgi:hypothetical protein